MAKVARKSPQAQLSPADAELENKILNYFLLFFSCALIGWLWEVAISFAQYGIFINRGVLHGPWLPIYGFGGLGIIILLRRFRKHPLVVFLSSIVLCGTIEYFTGWYLETFKHMKWWDYSGDFMNLHGRICLLALTSFGLAALFLVYFAYPRLIAFFNKIPIKPKEILCFALVLCFLGDFVYSSDNPNTGNGISSEVQSTDTSQE